MPNWQDNFLILAEAEQNKAFNRPEDVNDREWELLEPVIQQGIDLHRDLTQFFAHHHTLQENPSRSWEMSMGAVCATLAQIVAARLAADYSEHECSVVSRKIINELGQDMMDFIHNSWHRLHGDTHRDDD